MELKIKRKEKPAQPEKQGSHKIWIGTYLFLLLACIATYFLLKLDVFEIFGSYRETTQKILLGGIFGILILLASKITELFIEKKSHSHANRYNLVRVIRLLTFLLILVVFVSVLFVNWYAAAVSLGLISLILGFALQTPISSFIGWLYVVLRVPYRVGDRIQINTFTGDVVDIGYLDTTLWEFAGDYLTNDLPSGRVIRFPNTIVLQSQVYNYSSKKFPFIWNEISLHIAYESDLKYVESVLRSVTEEEMGDQAAEHIRSFKDLVQHTPIDDMQIKEYPFVCFRTNTNTWVEAVVTYLVPPKEAASFRSRLLKKMVNELLKQPEKVMFPKSNAR